MFRPIRLRLGAVAVALLLAGCGSTHTTSTTNTKTNGPAYQTSTLEISTESCAQPSASGSGATGHCVIVLSDGSRYRCPQASTGKLQSATAVKRAADCTKLSPFKIPATWKPVLKQLSAVRACFAKAGTTVTGGATLGVTGRTRRTPIGELTLVGTSAPTLINFYESAAAAAAAEPGLHANSVRSGGTTLRHGTAIIAWSAQPDPTDRVTAAGCLRSR